MKIEIPYKYYKKVSCWYLADFHHAKLTGILAGTTRLFLYLGGRLCAAKTGHTCPDVAQANVGRPARPAPHTAQPRVHMLALPIAV
jgi:hypothetical protein